MNFLAHLYLSGKNEHILMGNFIADSVKGKKAILQFPENVQKGIIIHRDIDFFMDTHPIVKDGMGRLREKYPKYSGVIMDIFYDHFLAKNWSNYSNNSLLEYTNKVYSIVGNNQELLIGKSKMMFPYMKRDNWLLSYGSITGIESILRRMTNRINHNVSLHHSVNELQLFYNEYDNEFELFFKEMMSFVKDKYSISL